MYIGFASVVNTRLLQTTELEVNGPPDKIRILSVTNHLLDQTSPVSMASASLDFHFSATSFARGSSGLGALSNAWIDSSTVRICRAGDHLSEERKKIKNGET